MYSSLSYSQDVANQTTQRTPGGTWYLEYLPEDYASSDKDYPIIIFLHGLGERGTGQSDIDLVARHGPPKHIKNGHDMTFEVDGTTHSFIVISPQLRTNYGSWNVNYVNEIVQHVKNTYRYDKQRFYFTGLSLGGGGVWNYAGDHPEEFAAIAPVCGAAGFNTTKAQNIGLANLPVWAFHGENDGTVSPNQSKAWVNGINSCIPTPDPEAILTLYPGIAHNAWDRAYQPDHQFHDPNVFEWLLSYKKNRLVVDAGKDRIIEQPQDSVHLKGKVSLITSREENTTYSWTQLEGPNTAVLTGSGTTTLIAESLIPGVYKFRLTVSNNDVTEIDEVEIEVLRINLLPIANAGLDRIINTSQDTILVDGSGSYDPDGVIQNYQWKQISGVTSGYKVYINFSGTTAAASPWNNTPSNFRNSTITNLLGENGVNTGISVEMYQGWWDFNDLGTITGDDSGVFPDDVMKTNYWFKDNQVKLRVANLTVGQLYNFTFFGSRSGTGNRTTTYTINGQAVSLNAASNTDEAVMIKNITPSSLGEVEITIERPSESLYAYLAAMVIETGSTNMQGVDEAQLVLSDLAEGSYTYELTVTDDLEKTGKDTVAVYVSESMQNIIPTANAGADGSITAPETTYTLDGSLSSDSDGSIVTYNWEKISGPETYTITTPENATTTITGLVPGRYIFQLEVTDDKGDKNTDEIIINVYAGEDSDDDCGCDHVLDNTSGHIYLDGSTMDIQPGDVICLKAGYYAYMNMWNFDGTEQAPITIKNCGGQVVIGDGTFHYGLILKGKNFHLTGTGDANYTYGIKINGTTPGSTNMGIGAPSTNFEVDHIESAYAGFAGMMIKEDPKCDVPESWRRNYEMQNVRVHDNYIHDSGGEGFYIGFTGSSKDCEGDEIFPHLIKDIHIYNNIIENAGWDGIQLVSAYGDVQIYNNFISNYGTKDEKWQQTGLQVGLAYPADNTERSHIYNNLVENGTGPGTLIMGTSANFYNNIYRNVATSSTNLNDGIYISNGTEAHDNGYNFINNMVFAHPNARHTIIGANTIGVSRIMNNILNGEVEQGDEVEANIVVSDSTDLEEKVKDMGVDATSYGVTFDFNNASRPQGSAFDIGPYEYAGGPTPNISPIAKAGDDKMINISQDTILVDGSESYDPDGTIESYQWKQIGGLSSGYKVYINFTGTTTAASPWNNTPSNFRFNSITDLLGENGANTGITIEMYEGWWDSNDLGTITDNNSGVFPDDVMKTNYWFKDNEVKLRVSNLTAGQFYSFTFFGSREGTGNRTTTYTINGQAVSLNASGNTNETVVINNITPDASGEVDITIGRPSESLYAYLAAMVIEKAGCNMQGADKSQLMLSELTEGDYEFELTVTDDLGETGKDTTVVHISENIQNVSPTIDYTYYEGTWDQLPDFASLTPVKTGKISEIQLEERESDNNFGFVFKSHITIPKTGSYTFGTSSDDGSKLYIGGYEESNLVVDNDGLHGVRYRDGSIVLDSGIYPIMITFFEKGGSEILDVYWSNTAHGITEKELIPSESFINYIDEVDNSNELSQSIETPEFGIAINFTSTLEAELPWNNTSAPKENLTFSELTNKNGETTNVSLTLVGSWNGGTNEFGMTNGIYPENVTKSSYWLNGQQTITIDNLPTDYVYSFIFFSSRNGDGNRDTKYTINDNTVVLSASFNEENTVEISGIMPDENGSVSITLEKGENSLYGYINALEIQAIHKDLYIEASENLVIEFSEPYPNPVESIVSIDITSEIESEMNVSIIDQMGTLLYSESNIQIPVGESIYQINFDNVTGNSGIYFLNIITNSGQQTIKLIKE